MDNVILEDNEPFEPCTYNCKKGCKEEDQAPSGNCEVCGGLMFRSDGKSIDELVFEHESECRRIWNGLD